mmetsp:Transcript_26029/g.42548  ORF Transcript_26029/g.42548 Transcript_26029/m.42548 type:complete len:170 (-) Transcript_26029:170-679(-)
MAMPYPNGNIPALNMAAGNMDDYYHIAKDSVDAYIGQGNYPCLNPKCQRSKCSDKTTHWCFHCGSSYCGTHAKSHNNGGTGCNGIDNDQVLSYTNMKKGRCDKIIHKHNWQSNSLMKQLPNCPQFVEYYCSHCNQWYCWEHRNSHTHRWTECSGILCGNVSKVSKKGQK